MEGPQLLLQAGLVGAGVPEDVPLHASPSLSSPLSLLLLLVTMTVYLWTFAADGSFRSSLGRHVLLSCLRCSFPGGSFLSRPATGRGHPTLAQGWGWHPGVRNEW